MTLEDKHELYQHSTGINKNNYICIFNSIEHKTQVWFVHADNLDSITGCEEKNYTLYMRTTHAS